ncbi:hypothetical protein ALNOE001_11760 [Candidatus Methanobinarius endosymbioticus]|uniref:Uncharacterized protein n=1 Tax=Candidatus Methanobinarius endosymbioticus TaxID=2006182 RepID=A0A366MB53_9EURY|nr:hypothetical protein ALNOE001_11760 [Candidatus Methanobinarius endosymbioticus]
MNNNDSIHIIRTMCKERLYNYGKNKRQINPNDLIKQQKRLKKKNNQLKKELKEYKSRKSVRIFDKVSKVKIKILNIFKINL